MLLNKTTGETFARLARKMENEKVWKCENFTLGHACDGGPSELIDTCHHMKTQIMLCADLNALMHHSDLIVQNLGLFLKKP